jgi:hypothetical protein
MPRYYFHIHNDVEAIDEEGVELLDLKAAQMIALHHARFTAAQSIKDTGRIALDHRIDIADEQGDILDTIYFRDAVAIKG